jgi:restriction system protein
MIKPRQGSLFAVLLRSPWWVSALIALALFALARLWLPAALAAASTLPFVGIAAYTGWKRLQAPDPVRVAAQLAQLQGLSWDRFAALASDHFRRQGFEVGTGSGVADLELRRDGYATLVAARRWKVAQTGVGPLRELHTAWQKQGARDCIYISAGSFTEAARAFAAEQGIRLLHDAELAPWAAALPRA